MSTPADTKESAMSTAYTYTAKNARSGSYKIAGQTFRVTGYHPRAHVQSIRKATQIALNKNDAPRYSAGADLMLALNVDHRLGY